MATTGELDWVLHVDIDEFLAAVEVARRPELQGRPVVVGGAGDPTQRGVVATASYAAREFGVHSGMPLRTAARLCPDATFLPSDQPAYEAVSEQVMATLRGFGVVEVLGWDEAFLGAPTDDPEGLAGDVRRAAANARRCTWWSWRAGITARPTASTTSSPDRRSRPGPTATIRSPATRTSTGRPPTSPPAISTAPGSRPAPPAAARAGPGRTGPARPGRRPLLRRRRRWAGRGRRCGCG